MAIPSRTLRCWTSRLTIGVMSTIWLRWVVLTVSVSRGCACMVASFEKAEADGPPEARLAGADELELVFTRSGVEDAIADVAVVVQNEPQFGEQARELSRQAPGAGVGLSEGRAHAIGAAQGEM